MEIWQSAMLAIVCSLLCLLLRQYRPEFALVTTVLCSIFLFLITIKQISPVFSSLSRLVGQSSASTVYLKTMMKSFGVCYLAQLAADVCRDAGQTAIASKIELAGRVTVLILAMPMFFEILEIAVSMIA